MKPEIKNCAIYCRKSSEEGLDMDFNTLHAQRESCEAYITSQRPEGWKAIKTEYNDGGFSGGNLKRPALQKLLIDIKAGKVQTVVVYKIDRLTRSLTDFSKLVETFDAHNVTFVSVTQSFNTTTSMGRLTLNVLLSFAQFEREVSAERIRDKISASKKKGMWMGGTPPIGYETRDKKLVINQDDAKTAHHIFKTYLALGCVAKLKQELDSQGVVSKQRISKRGNIRGGKEFGRGALYGILKNPIYIGKIRHKEQVYDGQHDAIISIDLWGAVQHKLMSQAAIQRGHKKEKSKHLLKGLLFDSDNTPYSPDYTKKKNGVIYRYYISQNLIQYRDHPNGIMARLPAAEVERIVSNAVSDYFKNPRHLSETLKLDRVHQNSIIEHIINNMPSSEILIKNSIDKIFVHKETLKIKVDTVRLEKHLNEKLDLRIPQKQEQSQENYVIDAPFNTRRAHRGAIIISPTDGLKDLTDLPAATLKNLVRGIIWRDEHFEGTSIRNIAKREKVSESAVRKIIMRSFDTLISL